MVLFVLKNVHTRAKKRSLPFYFVSFFSLQPSTDFRTPLQAQREIKDLSDPSPNETTPTSTLFITYSHKRHGNTRNARVKSCCSLPLTNVAPNFDSSQPHHPLSRQTYGHKVLPTHCNSGRSNSFTKETPVLLVLGRKQRVQGPDPCNSARLLRIRSTHRSSQVKTSLSSFLLFSHP